MSELAVYQRLKAIAVGQLQAVEAEDLERYGTLSNEREALMGKLVSPADATARAAATQLLRDVLALDLRLHRSLRTSLDTTRGELGQLRQGHRAVRAYAPRMNTQGLGSRA
jgi:hypothetical protein